MNRIMEEARIKSHIQSLGFDNAAKYKAWCLKNGFGPSLNKTNTQFKSEYDHLKRTTALFYIKKDNQKITLKKSVELVKEGTKHFNDDKMFNCIASIYHDTSYPEYIYIDKNLFLEIILFLDQKTRLLEDSSYSTNICAIANILTKKGYWVRPWDSWTPKSYNSLKQFSSFVRHLFAKYPIPVFFDELWLKNEEQGHNWFIHVAQGGNIAKASGFIEKYPMTKKMAHYFMQAPDKFNFEEAWRYSQTKSLGGTDRLVYTLLNTPVFRTRSDNDFTLSLIKFFIDNPMLDMSRVGPIVDYIWNQKFTQLQRVINGRVEHMAPLQPNFSMTGRAVDSLLEQVERWHRQLGKEKKGGDLKWDHWLIEDFEVIDGLAEHHNQKIWRIKQLLNSRELSEEGRYMKHCVGSYGHSCARGSSSIWSLSLETKIGIEKLVTIEVGKNPSKIYQIRGKNNRLPTSLENSIINRWAIKEKIARLY
jgi:PcfJ-like protein